MSLIESIEDGKLSLSCLDIAYLNTHTASQVSFQFVKIVKNSFSFLTNSFFVLVINFILNLLHVIGSNNKECNVVTQQMYNWL